MAQNREHSKIVKKAPAQPLRPEESINSTTTAEPAEMSMREIAIGEADVVADDIAYGEMNEADARESGYIGEDGKAVH